MLANMPTSAPDPLTHARTDAIIPTRTRVLLLAVRKAIIEILNALEDYLGESHSVMSADERRMFQRWQQRQMGG